MNPREDSSSSHDRSSNRHYTSRRLNEEKAPEENPMAKLEALFGGSKTSTTGNNAATTKRQSYAPEGDSYYANPRRSLGRSPSEYRLRLERLRIARESEEVMTATNAFIEHHQLPDDYEILIKVLQHHSDEKILREAMGQISSLLMQGRLKINAILEDRLNTLQNLVKEESTRSYVSGLSAQLAQMKQD